MCMKKHWPRLHNKHVQVRKRYTWNNSFYQAGCPKNWSRRDISDKQCMYSNPFKFFFFWRMEIIKWCLVRLLWLHIFKQDKEGCVERYIYKFYVYLSEPSKGSVLFTNERLNTLRRYRLWTQHNDGSRCATW